VRFGTLADFCVCGETCQTETVRVRWTLAMTLRCVRYANSQKRLQSAVSVNIQTSVVYITSIAESNSFCHKKIVIPLVQNMTSGPQFDLENICFTGYEQGGSIEPTWCVLYYQKIKHTWLG
jgi:hypothetical protein